MKDEKVEQPGDFKNQPAYDKNGDYVGWVSRSMTVFCAVFCRKSEDDDSLMVLVSKRGPGTPDEEFRGAWNCQTGYLDYGETLRQAAAREIREETGVEVDPKSLIPYLPYGPEQPDAFVIDDPGGDKRQNVSFRYFCVLPGTMADYPTSAAGCEPGEVSDIKWVSARRESVEKMKWAFGHDEVLAEIVPDATLVMRKMIYERRKKAAEEMEDANG